MELVYVFCEEFAMSKAVIIHLLLLFITTINGLSQIDIESSSGRIIQAKDLNYLKQLNLNYCDTLNLEIIGLYPILKEQPIITKDYSILKKLLVSDGS